MTQPISKLSTLLALGILSAPTILQAEEATPSYSLDVDLLYMERDESPSQPLFSSIGALGTGDLLRAEGIDPGQEPGLNINFRAQMTNRLGFEFGGFFVNEFSSSLTLPGTPNGEGITQYAVGGSTSGDMDYTSKIFGLHLNATHPYQNGITVIGGLRHLSLDESFSMTYRPSNLAVNYVTMNNLFGAQLGVRADWNSVFGTTSGAWNGGVELLGGVLNNSISSATFGGSGVGPSNDNADETTWFVQAGINADYTVRPGLVLSLGYQALWIDDVAHVTDQIGTTEALASGIGGPRTTIRTDDILIHGIKFGLTYEF